MPDFIIELRSCHKDRQGYRQEMAGLQTRGQKITVWG